ncbi:MAG: AlpA family phage regulatory protein [Geminicoccaceae bacterium]
MHRREPQAAPPRLLRYEQVHERVPYTRQHLSRLEKAGSFPRRVQIGPNSVGWFEHEVEEWLANLPRAGAGEAE